jgi:RNase P/RNase MRP subunit p29
MNLNVNPKYLIYHDLIGFEAYMKSKSRKKESQSFKYMGVIINDTENLLYIKTQNQEIKKFIKKNYIFRIKIPKQNQDTKPHMLEFDGSKIVGRPENRLRHLKKKKRFRK